MRKHGVSHPTVRQALELAWPKPRRKMAPRASLLDPYKPVIDTMLRADLDAPRKPRHTAKRIFDRSSMSMNRDRHRLLPARPDPRPRTRGRVTTPTDHSDDATSPSLNLIDTTALTYPQPSLKPANKRCSLSRSQPRENFRPKPRRWSGTLPISPSMANAPWSRSGGVRVCPLDR